VSSRPERASRAGKGIQRSERAAKQRLIDRPGPRTAGRNRPRGKFVASDPLPGLLRKLPARSCSGRGRRAAPFASSRPAPTRRSPRGPPLAQFLLDPAAANRL
jgi:hypothetical protein